MWRGVVRGLIHALDAVQVPLYRATGGRIGAHSPGQDMLLLETLGRRTGRLRTHALLYVREGERYVLCASDYGAHRHPAWYLNLVAQPRAWVQVGPRRFPVLAATPGGEERARLWALLVREHPVYETYQRATSRAIPLVALTPTPERDPLER